MKTDIKKVIEKVDKDSALFSLIVESVARQRILGSLLIKEIALRENTTFEEKKYQYEEMLKIEINEIFIKIIQNHTT